MKNKKTRILKWLVFLAIFFFSLLLTEKFSQSFHFVDEEDHFVFAYYMNRGYKLYKDLSSNHQPLVYFLSSLVQKVSQPDSLFMLLRRNREAVFLYYFVWGVILLLQFGWVFLATALIFELTKYFIFGQHLLAESLTVYPLIYILGLSLKTIFFGQQKIKVKPKTIDKPSVILGLANFAIIFNTVPLLPSVLILDVLYLRKTKKNKEFLLGLILPTLALFLFISPIAWFQETIWNNLKYAIPQITLVKQNTDYFKFFIFPFLYFWEKDNFVFNHFIRLLTVVSLINFFLLGLIKKSNQFFQWLILFLLVMFFNNRVLEPRETVFYAGFHALPWYAGFIFLNSSMIKFIWFHLKTRIKFLSSLVFMVGAFYLLISKQMPYFQEISKDKEHNVNFYPYYLISQAIRTAADENDRLMVIPDESLIYWQTGVKPAGRQIVYYEWEYWVPDLKKDFNQVLVANPPEFIYADFKRIGPASYLGLLKSSLFDNYWQATREGLAQNLYLSKEKVKEIKENQWQEWGKLSFDHPRASEIE